MYKLTVYERAENSLLPIHTYIDEEKEILHKLAQKHMSNNADYVTILVTYKPQEVEVY